MHRKKKDKKNYKKRFSYLLEGLTSTEIYNLKKKYNIYTKGKWTNKKVCYITKTPPLIKF